MVQIKDYFNRMVRNLIVIVFKRKVSDIPEKFSSLLFTLAFQSFLQKYWLYVNKFKFCASLYNLIPYKTTRNF